MRQYRFIQSLIFAAAAIGGIVGFAEAQPSGLGVKNLEPAGEQKHPVKVTVTGEVVDDATGEPLAGFYMTQGELDRDHVHFDWAENTRQLLTRGHFVVEMVKGKTAPAVFVEADGYLPQCSGPVRSTDAKMTFRLKKGSGPRGALLAADGKPAAGLAIFLARDRERDLVALEGASLAPSPASARVRKTMTDKEGHFSFPPDLDDYAVVVSDEAGFAMVKVETLSTNAEVRLQPWSRIEGNLKIGAQPGANQTIRLADAFNSYAWYPRLLPPYSIVTDAKTDSSGHFVFPRVPPVDVKAFYSPSIHRGGAALNSITEITNITLEPGESRAVTIGGQGRPVIGKMELRNYTKPIRWEEQVFWIESIAPEPPGAPTFDAANDEFRAARSQSRTPDQLDAAESRFLKKREQISLALRDYYSTPAGRQYWLSKRSYLLRFSPDGSFRIDDVPGGKYELTVDLRETVTIRNQAHMPLIDLHKQEVDVPASPEGRSDTPLDLGAIRLVAQLHPGQPAPEFAVTNFDGQKMTLADYKGKFLLLNFWASWNAESAQELPTLKETFVKYSKDPRFAMLGLCLDTNFSAAAAFAAASRIDWPQANLGAWSGTDLPDRYGVESLPAAVLIDPRGLVIAGNLHGGYIEAAIDSALSAHE